MFLRRVKSCGSPVSYHKSVQSSLLLSTQFSPDGLVASLTDANGNALAHAYDGLDRLSTTTYPATSGAGATTETLTYDADSNIKTRVTRKGDTISFGYDTLNRLTTKTEPSGTVMSGLAPKVLAGVN